MCQYNEEKKSMLTVQTNSKGYFKQSLAVASYMWLIFSYLSQVPVKQMA